MCIYNAVMSNTFEEKKMNYPKAHLVKRPYRYTPADQTDIRIDEVIYNSDERPTYWIG